MHDESLEKKNQLLKRVEQLEKSNANLVAENKTLSTEPTITEIA